MPDLGPAELIIVLLVVVMIFGGSRVAELGSSLGKGIKEFKNAMKDDDDALPPAVTADLHSDSGNVACPHCTSENLADARFCNECGLAMRPAAVATA